MSDTPYEFPIQEKTIIVPVTLTPVPLTRRQKIRAGKLARKEAFAKMTPEEKSEYLKKQGEKRAKGRARRAKHPNTNARPYRWAQAVGNARAALEKMQDGATDLESAFSELNDIKSEFEDWQGNLPESLQQSALGEKLDAIVGLDFDAEPDFSDIESTIDEAENADLPLGFGRD